MSWDEFASAWSEAFDGYDLRRASGARRSFMRVIYRVSGAIRVKGSVTMMISLLCSVAVVFLASRGGPWVALAALALLAGQAVDTLTSARAVRRTRTTRRGRLTHFYQALVERFAEMCWLVAFLALGARPTPVVLCAFVIWAHEYLRAKVGGAAIHRAGMSTVGDRPLRVWLAVITLLLAALISVLGKDLAAGVVTMMLLCWVVLGLIGAGQLFAIIRKALASG